MQHPFRGMNELMAARGRHHVRGGDMWGLVICVQFISYSNLIPSPHSKIPKEKYPVYATLSILTGNGAWADAW